MKKVILALIVVAGVFASCSKNTDALNSNGTTKVYLTVVESDGTNIMPITQVVSINLTK